MRRLIAIAAVFSIFTGCAALQKYQTTSTPPERKIETEYYLATLKPTLGWNGIPEAFSLTILNTTDQDIEIDWNKTLFINNGQTSGGFMFEGVVYKDRNNQKNPDIIFGKNIFSKTIWPNNLVSYVSGQYGGWRHTPMSPGENGVSLVIKTKDQELRENMTVDLSYKPIK